MGQSGTGVAPVWTGHHGQTASSSSGGRCTEQTQRKCFFRFVALTIPLQRGQITMPGPSCNGGVGLTTCAARCFAFAARICTVVLFGQRSCMWLANFDDDTSALHCGQIARPGANAVLAALVLQGAGEASARPWNACSAGALRYSAMPPTKQSM